MAVRSTGREGVARIDLKVVENYISAYMSAIMRGSASASTGSELRRSALGAFVNFARGSAEALWLERALVIASKLLEEVQNSLGAAGYDVVGLTFKLVSPGLVGAGGGPLKSVFEVGLSIDPVLGLPYYSGSSIKGAMRALVEESCGGPETQLLVNHLFGYSREGGEEGHLFVSDMYPVGCVTKRCGIYRGLVVSPHYMRGGEAVETEADAEPTPLQHLGVEEGVAFRVVLGHRLEGLLVDEAKEVVEALKSLLEPGGCLAKAIGSKASETLLVAINSGAELKEALMALSVALLINALRLGVGARSAKGYNHFELLGPNEKVYGPGELEIVGYSYDTAQFVSMRGGEGRRPVRERSSRRGPPMGRRHEGGRDAEGVKQR